MKKKEWFQKKEYSRIGMFLGMFLGWWVGAVFGFLFGFIMLVFSFSIAYIVDNHII